MASTLKRDPVKYVRDAAKNLYLKGDECYICGTKDKLEFHHLCSITMLWNKWINSKGIEVIATLGKIIDLRDEFIEEHKKQMYDDALTLCVTHHDKLHNLFGRFLETEEIIEKQRNWVALQRKKLHPKEKDVSENNAVFEREGESSSTTNCAEPRRTAYASRYNFQYKKGIRNG
jgi:hypothetical protein